ncbi:retrovirus-related pol polyprotein from transposon TNT 1-94 [Tanacetum coccineum]
MMSFLTVCHLPLSYYLQSAKGLHQTTRQQAAIYDGKELCNMFRGDKLLLLVEQQENTHLTVIPTLLLIKTMIWICYDSDCDELNSATIALMAEYVPEWLRRALKLEERLRYQSFRPILHSSSPVIVEVPKELPKVSMVNTSLKELKRYLTGFDQVVKERTTATTITEGVRLSTSASGSQPSGNTKNDRILHYKHQNVQNSKKHDNSDYVCINGDDCMSSDNLCVSNSMVDVKFRAKPKKRKSKKEIWKPTGKVFTKIGYIWRPTGQTFTIVGNACPLTRITTTNEVPSRKPIVLESESPKPVVNLVYSRKPRKNKNTESVSKTKVVQIFLWYLDSGCSKHMTGDRSQLTNFISKFLGTVKFGNDQVAKIMGYGDYQIGNVTISRVYYVEGLGHNLFSVGQFCDSNLEVAFRQHTCFIRNLEGVDLLTGSRGDNLYTLSLGNMMASSPICLLSKASKTKSWLWHRRLSHLNFGAINHLARHGLVRGLPKLKFEKDHLCSACALGKSSKKPHKPKSEDTNQEKLYLLHMDLCGPMRVASVNGKKYILVIVDDYSRFTWVKCLRSKDELNSKLLLLTFVKICQVRHKETVLASNQIMELSLLIRHYVNNYEM